MDLRDFEYIVEIAKQGGISKAAENLCITQPSLSKFLRKKEEELGIELFERSGRRYTLTEAGSYYVQYAKRILDLNQKADLEIHKIASSRCGTIRLGVTTGRLPYITSVVLKRFRERFPDISLVLEVRTTGELVRKLQQGEFDLIVINFDHWTDLEYEKIGRDELVLVVPKEDELCRKARIDERKRFPVIRTADWFGKRFIMPSSDTSLGQLVYRYFQRKGITPLCYVELQRSGNITLAVKNGVGISMIPSFPRCEEEGGELCYFSLDDEEPLYLETVAVMRKGSYRTKIVDCFIGILKETYASEQDKYR